MKINFVIPIPGNSGGLKVIYKYAELFERKGNEVKLFFPIVPYILDHNMPFMKKIFFICSRTILNIYRYIIGNYGKNFSKQVTFQPVFFINNRSISEGDAIIATAWPTAFSVNKLKQSKGKKFYFVQDYEVWDDRERGVESYKLDLNKIIIAKWIGEKIIEQTNSKAQLPIVHNGIDIQFYQNENKHYLNNHNCTCLMLYHCLEKKGVKYGIKAFEIAKKKYPNIELIMFGIKKGYDVPDYVEFHENPTSQEIHDIYKKTDIFIFPSLVEGWGLTVVEAMASRCAVVGTNTGCLLEFGENGEDALISGIKNEIEMGSNIIKLIENPTLLRKIADNGYETVQQFDWDISTNRFLELITY